MSRPYSSVRGQRLEQFGNGKYKTTLHGRTYFILAVALAGKPVGWYYAYPVGQQWQISTTFRTVDRLVAALQHKYGKASS